MTSEHDFLNESTDIIPAVGCDTNNSRAVQYIALYYNSVVSEDQIPIVHQMNVGAYQYHLWPGYMACNQSSRKTFLATSPVRLVTEQAH